MPLDFTPDTGLEGIKPALTSRCGSVCEWAVAQTHPQAEHWASANLSRQGYENYLPLIAVRRRDPVHRTISRVVHAPLFSGYLFVVAGTHWAPIQHTRGVARLLMCDGKPGRVRRGIVEAIRASEDARRSVADPNNWAPGAPCRIAHGPFASHHAVVTAVAGDTARVAVMMLGAIRELAIGVEWLEPR